MNTRDAGRPGGIAPPSVSRCLETLEPRMLLSASPLDADHGHTHWHELADRGGSESAVTADAQTGPLSLAGFSDEAVITSGVSVPLSMAFLPDNRMLILEKDGTIFIADPNTGNKSVYMQLSNINTGQERGLLDIALAPDFDPDATSVDQFYLLYTTSSPNRLRVAQFNHQENGGGLTSTGDLSSEVQLWQDTEGFVACCHYGGGIDFGPDGKLWVTTGDKFTGPVSGEGGPDTNLPQDLNSAAGKVIRINRDGSAPDGTDGWAANPFVDPTDDDPNVAGNQDYHDYIWAWGLRNPFRAQWDLPSGRFFIGEVGGNQHSVSTEDIHVATLNNPGANYGWPYFEGTPGTQVLDPNGVHAPDHGFGVNVTEPIYEIPHNGSGASLTGGEVYRGSQFPSEWQGVYFYGDYTDDYIRYLTFDTNGDVSGSYDFKPSAQLPGNTNQVIHIAVGNDGALYYSLVNGDIRRVVHSSANQAPQITAAQADVAFGDTPLTVNFTADVTDPESDGMTYRWVFGDGTEETGTVVNGQANAAAHVYSGDGVYNAFLEVSDSTHTTVSQVITIQAGAVNTAPTIDSLTATPVSGTAPLLATFSATVSDAQSDPMTFELFFGDGNSTGVQAVPANGQINVMHTYATDGVYDATLSVSDGVFTTNGNAPAIAVGDVSRPPVSTDLVFHIESDIKVPLTGGSTVTGWLDQSGLGNNLDAFGDPQFVPDATPGGQAAVVFDGDGDKLERFAVEGINNLPIGAADRTVFAVVEYIDAQGKFTGFAYGEGSPNEAFGLVTNSNAGNLTVQGWGGGNDFPTATPGEGEGWLIQSAVLSSNTLTQYLNGSLIDTDTHTFATDLAGPNSKIVVGEEIAGAGYSEMSLAAVLIYDRALSESERLQVENYLNSKYIIGNDQPTAQPDSGSVATGGSVVIPVLDNDFDTDGVLDPASVTVVGGPANGSTSVNTTTGAITYTHDGGVTTSDSFTYTVRDEVGTVSSPATVSITVSQAQPGSLITAGLVVHLDAQLGVGTGSNGVNSWLDSSGNGNDLQTVVGDPQLVTGATPGGKPAIDFDGNDSLGRLTTTDPLNNLPAGAADRTMFLVARYDGANAFAGASFGDGQPNETFGLVVNGNNGNLTLQGWGGGNDFNSGQPGSGEGWLVQSVVLEDNAFVHYLNGAPIDSGTHTFGTDLQKLLLAQETAGNGFADMQIAALLVYDTALSEADRQSVEDYLQTTYFTTAPANTAPTITSPSAESVAENTTAVQTVTATDPDVGDNVTFSISGGDDAALFQIGGTNGDELSFVNAPDFENPQDNGTNNVYEIEIAAFDGTDTTTQLVSVTVTDVNENTLPGNLVLRLDATNGITADSGTGAISAWADQSGQSNDVFGTGAEQPIFGQVQTPSGIDAVSFDGADDRLLRDLNDAGGINGLPTGNDDRTMFVVAKFDDATWWGGAAYGEGASNQAFGLGVVGSGASKGSFFLHGFGGGNDLITNINGFNEGWVVLSTVHIDDGTNPADNGFIYLNGTSIDSWSHQFATDLSNSALLNGNKTASRLVLGEETKEAGHQDMDVAAVWVFDSALNETDRLAVEAFLQDTYLTVPPPNTAPTITSPNSENVAENTTAVQTITTTDPDVGDTVTFSISGGDDAALFQLGGVNGDELSFIAAPDFENPQDNGTNNVYEVEIAAFDGTDTTNQLVSVTVTDVPDTNTAPTITSPNSENVAENTTAVQTITATDPDVGDTVTFSISGGDDAALFQLGGVNGDELSFIAAPDFENPQDNGTNNAYEVEIAAFDGIDTTTQLLSVTVTDVTEGTLPGNLVLRLDATAGLTADPGTGAVSIWADQSGEGNDVFGVGAEQPTFGLVQTPSGLDAVSFDGADDRLLRDLNDAGGINGLPTGNADRTMFVVARFDDATWWGGAAYGEGVTNQTFGLGVVGNGTSKGNFVLQGYGGGNDLVTAVNGFNEGWVVLSTVHIDDGTNPADNGFIYLNGTSIDSWSHQFATDLSNSALLNGNKTASRLVLGEETKEAGHQDMDVAAVWVFDSALNETDRLAVEAFLQNTYLAPAPAASVVGRQVFYNDSFFDGGSDAADSNDDGAIATDKAALLPGQTATFANYTSYAKGLNGVMVDIADLASTSLTAADFEFRVGNTADPSTWAAAPAPLPVTVRAGAGVGGSDRVTLRWAEGAIQKQWLQVRVLANANTGLAADDVFYFGNAVGESGNDPANARVNLSDVAGARDNQTGFGFADISNNFDYTRDRRVTLSDVALARENQSGFTPLLLLSAPSDPAPLANQSASAPPIETAQTTSATAVPERTVRTRAAIAPAPRYTLAPRSNTEPAVAPAAQSDATAASRDRASERSHRRPRANADGRGGSWLSERRVTLDDLASGEWTEPRDLRAIAPRPRV